ncbi:MULTISPECIES: DUF3268 family zinc-finger domain-containing protein [unclassified Janthinobacterium]|uniref:DUF3268 family zinc-finger domain-containing protein n=1 Tax=unclassified Janthinobacterium TaxID=2610881 RepID=UPI00180CDCAA|nr:MULTISPECIES: DUF3268 family zinc-finger domain-containing protein [unclassified Janthinobacterium]MBB5610383.1 hypothetical protein [Janthinobacterium sp. S3T4]MBB5615780.1 hypothetical protein [Janthinobacterium sp. S3M3]
MIGTMQKALTKAGMVKPRTGPVTPQNPSRSATARVKNPLPAPIECPYCGDTVELVNNSEIYGRPYGEWPWAYRCADSDCNSYVGLHPLTGIPLGTLANTELRKARKDAKAAFNPIWQSGEMTRNEAYAWLADALRIENAEECHIGWFDLVMCRQVTRQCYRRRVAQQVKS